MKEPMKNHFSEFECRCLTNRWGPHTNPEKVESLWKSAVSRQDFIKAIQADDDLKLGQACGILSRGDFFFIRQMIGDRQIKTLSDAGGVRVGTDGFQVIIPNGRGDGETRVGIIPAGSPFNTDCLNYFTSLCGHFTVYDSDCGQFSPVAELTGDFSVYFGAGFVVFVEAV